MLFRVFFDFVLSSLSFFPIPLFPIAFPRFSSSSSPLFLSRFPYSCFPEDFSRLSRKARTRQRESEMIRHRGSSSLSQSTKLSRVILSRAGGEILPATIRAIISSAAVPFFYYPYLWRSSIWRCVSLRRDTSAHASQWIFPARCALQ